MSKIYLINTGFTQYIEGKLPVTSGIGMFSSCTNLTSFNGDLPSLTNANNMFSGCTNLTSFNGDLFSLTNGTYMFQSCKKLKSFNSDLSSLTSGDRMFGSASSNCSALNLESVQNIAETINDLASKGLTGTIHIGMSNTLKSDDETAPINVALAAIRAKGWTVNEVYNSIL